MIVVYKECVKRRKMECNKMYNSAKSSSPNNFRAQNHKIFLITIQQFQPEEKNMWFGNVKQ